MPDHLEFLKANHLNAITDGFAETREHFGERLGFETNMVMPDRGDGVDACLMTLGRVMFEFFCPKERGEKGQGRLLDRFGDHYVGIEFQVPDVTVARKRCADLGVRIINDVGMFFFTYGGACHGISFELWDGDWHAEHPENPGFTPVSPLSYWRDEHPMGIVGASRVSVAVEDLDAAIATFRTLTGSEVISRVERPRAGAHGAQLQAGDTVFELLAPTGDGAVADYLERYGERIRSVVYACADLARTERHLTAQGFTVVPGDADDAIAIPPEENKFLHFEFTAA